MLEVSSPQQIQDYLTRISAATFKALKELGVYDNYAILLGIQPEEAVALLVGLNGFQRYRLKEDPDDSVLLRKKFTFTDDNGMCALVVVAPYSRSADYPTRVWIHADYHNQGREQEQPRQWLHPIRDAIVAIASAAMSKGIALCLKSLA